MVETFMSMSLDEVMDRIESKYRVEIEPVKINGKKLKLLQIKNLEEYVVSQIEKEHDQKNDSGNGSEQDVLYHLMHLPWWAKLWEPSFVLAYFMGKQPVIPGQRILEIGAGLGFVGVFAAMCGHDVTISDIEEDALLFCRANALLNGCRNVPVIRIDWRMPFAGEPYDMIIGSEVVYDRKTYGILVDFLDNALAPNGTVILAKNKDLKTPLFFQELVKKFKFKEKAVKLSGPEGTLEVMLYAIKRKVKNVLR